jgi:transposase
MFVDECGTQTSTTRRRSRGVRGSRPGAVPRNRGPVTTPLTGLSLARMSPAITVEGGTTAAVLAAYLQRVLVPALRPWQVVVVDHVSAHQPERMHQLIQAAGCEPVFLPAYSPDLSPVEETPSKIKSRVRTALDTAIAAALEAVTAANAGGWFHRAGYPASYRPENRCPAHRSGRHLSRPRRPHPPGRRRPCRAT